MNLKQITRTLFRLHSSSFNSSSSFQYLIINTNVKRRCLSTGHIGKEFDQHHLKPSDIKCMYAMASSMKAVKSYQEALQYYQQIIKVSNTVHLVAHDHIGHTQHGHVLGMSWLESGNCLNLMHRYEEALDCFTTMLNFNTDKAFYQILGHYGRATCYFNMGKYREAIHDYSQTILFFASKATTQHQAVDSSQSYYYRALCHLHLKEYEQAISDFSIVLHDSSEQELVELESNSVMENDEKKLTIYFSRATAFMHTNKLKRALGDINRCVDLHERVQNHNIKPHELYRTRAEILIEMKDLERARANLLKTLELSPTDVKALSLLSSMNN